MIENSIRHGYDVSFIGPRPGMSSGTRTSGRLEDYALGLQATGRLADNFIKLFESKPGNRKQQYNLLLNFWFLSPGLLETVLFMLQIERFYYQLMLPESLLKRQELN